MNKQRQGKASKAKASQSKQREAKASPRQAKASQGKARQASKGKHKASKGKQANKGMTMLRDLAAAIVAGARIDVWESTDSALSCNVLLAVAMHRENNNRGLPYMQSPPEGSSK